MNPDEEIKYTTAAYVLMKELSATFKRALFEKAKQLVRAEKRKMVHESDVRHALGLIAKLTKDGDKDHPEHHCHRCGGKNMHSWHTDNETWNELARGSGQEVPGIICPSCLDELDRKKHGDYSHWYITKKSKLMKREHIRWFQWPFVILFLLPVVLCLWIRNIIRRLWQARQGDKRQ